MLTTNSDSAAMHEHMKDGQIAVSDQDSNAPPALSFQSDKGYWGSFLAAFVFLLVVVLWMGSGFIYPNEEEEEEQAAAAGLINVAVRASQAQTIPQVFSAEGQALPDRESALVAEIAGEVAELKVRKGAFVEANDVIAILEVGSRMADLERAEENLTVAQAEFDNADQLLARGAATADRVRQARANLVAAKAEITAAQQDIDDTIITVPFGGRIDELGIDLGEFVSAGTTIGRVVDIAPLSIVVQVPQQSLASLQEGQPAEVAFITGQVVSGEVVFIASSADSETRTFRVEIEVQNEDNAIPAGLSAQVRIPTGTSKAHFVSPAILSLGSDGGLGIKTVDDQDRVVFNEVSIVLAETGGIWVSGLPDDARIITIGQGFVNDGETVNPQSEDDAATGDES